MIEKIKALRVQIDGLAQLVLPLSNTQKLIVDLSYLPKHLTLKDFLTIYKEDNLAIIESHEGLQDAINSVRVINIGSHQCQKAYDSLILAKAWLGKILGELGNPTPYQNDGKRKDVKDIEPTADRLEIVCTTGALVEKHYVDFNHIEKVDWLRQAIQKVIDNKLSLDDFTTEEQNQKELPPGNCGWYESIYQQYLMEARFWLGFELQRIREEQTK